MQDQQLQQIVDKSQSPSLGTGIVASDRACVSKGATDAF